MNPAEGSTIIGPGTKVVGELSGADNLLIQGEVEGTISLPGGRVTVGEQGRVRASIFAQEILISGRVQGELRATTSITLRASAMVLGDLITPRFIMEEDSLLRGNVEPASPEEFAGDASRSKEHNTLPAGLAAAERHLHDATTAATTDTEAESAEHEPSA